MHSSNELTTCLNQVVLEHILDKEVCRLLHLVDTKKGIFLCESI